MPDEISVRVYFSIHSDRVGAFFPRSDTQDLLNSRNEYFAIAYSPCMGRLLDSFNSAFNHGVFDHDFYFDFR